MSDIISSDEKLITDNRLLSFVQQQAAILELVATDQKPSLIYDAIALMYESRHPGLFCSLLTLQGDKLIHGGAPSLPVEYCMAVDGLQNGPNVGSCGSATFTGKRVLVEDIATDPKWADLKKFALPHGLRCCWSEPIKCTTGKILGAFGMYYKVPKLPDEKDIKDLESAARLAGIVMRKIYREEEHHKLSSALAQSGQSMLITDSNGIIEYVNEAFTKLSGYRAEEVIGNTPRILKSGNQDNAYYEKMWNNINEGKIWHNQIINKRKNGSFFPCVLNIAPIVNSENIITNFVGTHSDLSEIANIEEQFLQVQKMEAIGTLIGGIAHDFNNILASITGNIYLGKKAATPKQLEKFDNIEKLTFRAADMIKKLLTFARKDKVELKAQSFSALIKERLKFLKSLIPENIQLQEDICTETLLIVGDESQLHQVLMNLITNARDAVEGVNQPIITVKLEKFTADHEFIKDHHYFKSGEYAHLTVMDNGSGIEKHQLKHLFEPFFTTKELGKGVGLGLSMVFGAVKTHQGFVEAKKNQEEGASFHIYIPLISDSEISIPIPQKISKGKRGQGQLILLADDEQHLLNLNAEILESLGYKVLLARDGIEAIEVFKAHSDEIFLVMLDIMMPNCNGVEAAKRIKELDPDQAILFVSGYDKTDLLKDYQYFYKSKVLSKPVMLEVLDKAIKDIFD